MALGTNGFPFTFGKLDVFPVTERNANVASGSRPLDQKYKMEILKCRKRRQSNLANYLNTACFVPSTWPAKQVGTNLNATLLFALNMKTI